MKKQFFNVARRFAMIFLSAVCMSFFFVVLNGQSPENISVVDWADDTHYVVSSQDGDGNNVLQSVSIRNGKSAQYTAPKSSFEKLQENLADVFTITRNDIISPYNDAAVVDVDNDLYYISTSSAQKIQLTNDAVKEVNTRFSPDGGKLAYTKNKDLYVYDINNKREIRLTNDATDKIFNGYAAWVYMEEILGRASQYAAFWWSPDGKKLAFLRTDESEIEFFTLNRLDKDDGLHGLLEQVPYPKAGEPTPRVKMGIADIATGKITWVKTDYSVDQYIAWPFWTPDSKQLAIQIINRDQNDLQIILANAETGDYKEIYREKHKSWVEFREDVYVMNNGSGFILRSYRSGWENLYYYDWSGNLIAQLTDFDFRVTDIDMVDEINKVVYFYATGEESTDSHYYRVGLDGKGLIQITKGSGTHNVLKSPGGSYFVDTWSSITDRGGIIAYDKKGKQVKEIVKYQQPANAKSYEFVKIKTSDGLFDMPAIITYPVNFDPSKKYPVVFTIYGGPDYKNVYNMWQGSTPSWYAQNGIIEFKVDHRGSGQFGKEGLDYLYRNLGDWEIKDYSDAVVWLRSKPYVDGSKIGITGSSYGGYMTCMALTKGADYWTHGFAGSSVTDWRLYDNIYTERFMDTPQDNPEGYDSGSVLTYTQNLKGSLYFNHGDLDDNVHMQNSIWLISKLEDEGKVFQFMLYPNGRHGWSGMKRVHSSDEQKRFWLKGFFGIE